MMNSRLLTVKAFVSRGTLSSLIPMATTTATSTNILTQSQQQYRTKKTKTGSRGSRGHGWYTLYRSGRGGRHLQGKYYNRDLPKLQSMNEDVFGMGSEFVYLDISVGDDDVVSGDDVGGGDGKEEEMKKKKNVGRVVIELATAALPVTSNNFKQLCLAKPPPPPPSSSLSSTTSDDQDDDNDNDNNNNNNDIGYLHTKAYTIDKTIGIAFGDVLHNNGISGQCHPSSSSSSITSSSFNTNTFADEHKVLSHCTKGMLTMLSSCVHGNDSRFLIQTVEDAPHLDGRYVAFGRVVDVDVDVDVDDVKKQEEGSGGGGGMGFLMENVVKGVFTKKGRPTVDVKIVGCGVLSQNNVLGSDNDDDGDDKVAAA